MLRYKEKAQHLVCGASKCCSSKDKEQANQSQEIKETSVTFALNGKQVTLNSGDVKPTLSLARYIRDVANLKGTKIYCNAGDCGTCTVTVKIPDPVSGGSVTTSVNSCLAPVFNCNGWEITTVEGLGNEQNPHPVQERLAAFNGTQCGFCTPGMVMQMNSLIESKNGAGVTKEEVEHAFDGNICRCTGYRPILDAFKSFAQDEKSIDIEDSWKCCKSKQAGCNGKRVIGKVSSPNGGDWYMPASLSDLLTVIAQLPQGASYALVNGNTGGGITDSINAYISIKNVPQLQETTLSPTVSFGAGISISAMIALMDTASVKATGYGYCKVIANHLRKVAHTSVRNAGSVGGNLMLKHNFGGFPSDIFPLMEASGARFHVKSADNVDEVLTPLEFLAADMAGKILLKIELPAFDDFFISYKAMQRHSSAYPYINGVLKIKFDSNFVVMEQPTLVYGGVSPTFNHATVTEKLLVGKSLKSQDTLTEALSSIQAEVSPLLGSAKAASAEYKSYLAQALFYRFILAALGDSAPAELQSGAYGIERNVSGGSQTFETDSSLYPINEPIEKYEAKLQCTGEAIFTNDIPLESEELHAAFVYSSMANCELDVVDITDAMNMPGVVAYIDHNDIPGKNSAILSDEYIEEIFTTGKVNYAGQAIGLILAKSFEEAVDAAKAVSITYKNQQKPILTIKEALAAGPTKVKLGKEPFKSANFDAVMKRHQQKGLKMAEGEFEVGSQFHYYIESQTTVAKPSEKGQIDIYSSTQHMENVQLSVAQALNKPEHLINVETRRVGGAFGGKTRIASYVAAATAVAANKMGKPVRLVMDIQSNLAVLGKRHPFLVKYKSGADEQGKLQFVSMTIYSDSGYSVFEDTSGLAVWFGKNCYESVSWELVNATVITHTASNTIMRAPGTAPGHAMMENIIEHLAFNMGRDPLDLRMANMIVQVPIVNEVNPLPEVIDELKRTSNYEARKAEVAAFNQQNKWKKRGLSLIPMLYHQQHTGATFSFQISVYRGDGTIAISHGGMELGQGINTKVLQTVAKEMKVDKSLISIKPNNNFISPQNSDTAGSKATDCVCSMAIIACQKLLARIQEVADTMENPTWVEVVEECYARGVDLSERHTGLSDNDIVTYYNVYSASVMELELDVLTGEINVRRADIIEDMGTSINPNIDVGQIEGALVQALGLWLSEQITYDPSTGKLMSFYEYKVPTSRDIPEQMNVTFYNGKGNTQSGVYGSKAIGEQGFLLGASAIFALRRAIDSVKSDHGQLGSWYTLGGPATPENTHFVTGITAKNFVI